MSEWWTRRLSIQLSRLARLRPVVTVLGLAILLGACEGGSGQSGGAFVFLSVDGFFLTQGAVTSSIPSSTSQVTTTNACVILRNNAKNPTLTTSNALDNVTIRSYTLRLNGRTFTFGAAVLVPAGTVTMGNVSGNTSTFAVVVAPGWGQGRRGLGRAGGVHVQRAGRSRSVGRGRGGGHRLLLGWGRADRNLHWRGAHAAANNAADPDPVISPASTSLGRPGLAATSGRARPPRRSRRRTPRSARGRPPGSAPPCTPRECRSAPRRPMCSRTCARC